MLPIFRKTVVKDPDLRLVQDAVSKVFGILLPKPIIDGRLIEDVQILLDPDSGDFLATINHGLQRTPLGWIVVRNNTDTRIWDLQDANPVTTKTLKLQASAETTISLWVF